MKKAGWIMSALLGVLMLGASVAPKLIGGIASHLRAGSPLFGYTLFGVYLGVFMWAAQWLRDERLRKLFPFSTN